MDLWRPSQVLSTDCAIEIDGLGKEEGQVTVIHRSKNPKLENLRSKTKSSSFLSRRCPKKRSRLDDGLC